MSGALYLALKLIPMVFLWYYNQNVRHRRPKDVPQHLVIHQFTSANSLTSNFSQIKSSNIIVPFPSTAGIAQSAQWLAYGLDNQGIVLRFQGWETFLQIVQTGSGTHPASLSMGTFPQAKAVGNWKQPFTPPTGRIKNAWIYTSTLPYAFMTRIGTT